MNESISYRISLLGWSETMSLEMWPLTGPLSTPQMIRERIWGSGGTMLTAENRRTRRKTCASATLSSTNPTRTALDA
jgi:hypothetical protein